MACTRFYIILNKPPESLDGNFSVFARVTRGLDVVRKIAKSVVDPTEPGIASRRLGQADRDQESDHPYRCREQE